MRNQTPSPPGDTRDRAFFCHKGSAPVKNTEIDIFIVFCNNISMINLAIDAMGGDHAPEEVVKGAVLAVKKCDEVMLSLTGIPEVIGPLLKKTTGKDINERIRIVGASEVIGTGDHPVKSVREKKDSSMMVGMKLVRDGEAKAFVSGGNSGALMVGAQVVIGRSSNVSRPPFAHPIPHARGRSLLLDCGANVDVRPEHILSFAYLGIDYMKNTMGTMNPTVGLVNIGAEESKGNALTVEAYQLLKEAGDIDFVGNVEPTGITEGQADILVCDGFTGNMIIKLYEGMGKLFKGILTRTFTADAGTKLGALLVRNVLRKEWEPFDAHSYGGAPILGLNAPVIKVHGNAVADEYCNAIMQCIEYLKAKGEKHGV